MIQNPSCIFLVSGPNINLESTLTSLIYDITVCSTLYEYNNTRKCMYITM